MGTLGGSDVPHDFGGAFVNSIGGRSVFFVRDASLALAFYTDRLGFTQDWTHEIDGRPFVVQVSLFGLQIILNQTEPDTKDRPGHGRIFVGLDDVQTARFLQHARSKGIVLSYTHWGQPTAVISDSDRNEIFIWLSDEERLKWREAHGAPPNKSLERSRDR